MAAVLPSKQHGTYTFASHPRAVQNRKKYRDPLEPINDEPIHYGNIMYDRRVIRGNTYAQTLLPAHAQPDPLELERQQENRRRALARKRARDQLKPRSPQPLDGRRHVDVQTELYLEELTDRIEEADICTQTDLFMDRPSTPLFIPAKTGQDMESQIYPGDLFDFDLEVLPILEVLVGKTVEQSLLEVMEEEELASLRAQQREFEELRNAELAEQQRLEEQERRHREEKIRRMKQQTEIIDKEKETAAKIAAKAFAHSYLSDLIPAVFGTLADHGYFYDPVERDVEENFMPWLMEAVQKKLKHITDGRTVVDEILREVMARRTETSQTDSVIANQTEMVSKSPTLTKEERGSSVTFQQPLLRGSQGSREDVIVDDHQPLSTESNADPGEMVEEDAEIEVEGEVEHEAEPATE